MSITFWNDRYAAEAYAYGTEPNLFFKDQLQFIPSGKLLLPAEGEGRNAVYAAEQGWDVVAFDQSTEGQKKGLKLADEKRVEIEYRVSEWNSFTDESNFFDAAAFIYIHLPADQRSAFHRKILTFIKPGGIVLLEGFSKEQLQYTSGGPKDEHMLFSLDEVRSDFYDVEILMLNRTIYTLHEGPYHIGKASVVRFVGKKK